MTDRKLRILVVDDDRRMVRTLADILKVKDYQVEAAHSAPEALEKLKASQFDCLLTDIKMPDMDGVALFQAVREMQPQLPVMLMTAYTSAERVQEGLDEGAVGVLSKPLDINLLLGLFSSLIDERPIVIIDDDPNFCRTMKDILQGRVYNAVTVNSVNGVGEALKQDVQLVLLDMKLDGTNGLAVLKEIRLEHPVLPVVLVTGHREEMTSEIKSALEISAFSYLYKPLQIEEFFQVIGQVHQQQLGVILGQPVKKPRGGEKK